MTRDPAATEMTQTLTEAGLPRFAIAKARGLPAITLPCRCVALLPKANHLSAAEAPGYEGSVKRSARLLLGSILALLGLLALAEAALRVGSLFVSERRLQQVLGRPGGNPVVAFIGDSQLYGLGVSEEETLPQQAQEVARRHGSPGFLAVNLGRNGAPSWVALDEARRSLPVLRPDIAVIRAGMTNVYTVHPDRAGLLDSLRLARVARIALRNLQGADARRDRLYAIGFLRASQLFSENPRSEGRTEDGVEFAVERGSAGAQWKKDIAPAVRADLVAIAEEARRAGAKVVFLSYLDPGLPYAFCSRDLAWVARETGSLFVDLEALAIQAGSQHRRWDFLFPDGHPTNVGYALEARHLVRSMTDAGMLSGSLPGDPLEVLAELPAQPVQPASDAPIRLRRSTSASGSLSLLVIGPPGNSGRVLMGRPGSGFRVSSIEVLIDREDADRLRALVPGLDFRLDAEGTARIELPSSVASSLPPETCAVAWIVGPADPDAILSISEAIVVATGKAHGAQ
jgi:hypothetical protein